MKNIYNGYDVYVKTNDNDIIIAINSSAFITDYDRWTLIETNVQGDKGHHAQGHYLDKSLIDENGIYNYKLTDGKPKLRTAEEKAPELERITAIQEILELKAKLAATDYIAAKIAEGASTREEYAEQIAQRESWREEIRRLETF